MTREIDPIEQVAARVADAAGQAFDQMWSTLGDALDHDLSTATRDDAERFGELIAPRLIDAFLDSYNRYRREQENRS